MTSMQIAADPDALARLAAEQVIEAAHAAVAQRGMFAVALAGGSTPRMLYRTLADPQFADRVDWSRVHVFWGDERCVPPDHPDSNYRMARDALLDYVPLPPAHVHRLAAETNPEQAARAYEQDIMDFFGAAPPRFDLILLGLGDDGHTASLFPGTAVLHETRHTVAANYLPAKHTWRLTFTYPTLNAASQVIFLVSGSAKAHIVQAVLRGPHQPDQFPAQAVNPGSGRLLWLLDQDAAYLLPV